MCCSIHQPRFGSRLCPSSLSCHRLRITDQDPGTVSCTFKNLATGHSRDLPGHFTKLGTDLRLASNCLLSLLSALPPESSGYRNAHYSIKVLREFYDRMHTRLTEMATITTGFIWLSTRGQEIETAETHIKHKLRQMCAAVGKAEEGWKRIRGAWKEYNDRVQRFKRSMFAEANAAGKAQGLSGAPPPRLGSCSLVLTG
jgi:hypothetical protein